MAARRTTRASRRCLPVLCLAALCLDLLLAPGCTNGSLAPLRAATYPPGFHYITRADLKGAMADFAREVDQLDGILARKGGADTSDRAAVVEILERMRLQAGHLEEGMSSNHPRLHQGVERFERDVERALFAARRDPPDYAWTARVTGGCTACHAPRERDAG